MFHTETRNMCATPVYFPTPFSKVEPPRQTLQQARHQTIQDCLHTSQTTSLGYTHILHATIQHKLYYTK